MTSMGLRVVQAVLAVLFIATVKADEGGVTFWMENFTMTCPGDGTWYRANKNISEGKTLNLKYENDKKGTYYCKYKPGEYDGGKYYFYVQGKVCENCFELDAAVFGLAIIMDTLLTAFVMVITYRCTKKKSSARLTHAAKAPAHSGGRGPPVPSPDYEQLNPHTLSQGTYSMVNRMG